MNIIPTALAGVCVVRATQLPDPRGSLSRFFCAHELAAVMGKRRIVQINHSLTTTVGTVRGLHFQHSPHTEMKLVRCLKGRVMDIAVDLRTGSPTFLQWHGEELTPESAHMLVIPEGCAHGFQVLEPNSELLYLHTAFHAPESEGGVPFDDPRVRICWPLPVTGLSGRDRLLPPLEPDFCGIPP